MTKVLRCRSNNWAHIIEYYLLLLLQLISCSQSASSQKHPILNADSLISAHSVNLIDKSQLNIPISPEKTLIWGPGLVPHQIVLPARYFYVHFVDKPSGKRLNSSGNIIDDFRVRIDCHGDKQVWTQILDRKDGSFIIRYKTFQSCRSNFRIILTYMNVHLGKSPYVFQDPVHPDSCPCPKGISISTWLETSKCLPNYAQLDKDLEIWAEKSVDFEDVLQRTIDKFHRPTSHSFCHYVILRNEVYRKCYGQHVGFHIFPDSILLSLTRKMILPDLEFIMNLGDWPLVDRSKIFPPLPIFSWCKTVNESLDILIPTYEITEASLEGMGRVSLDMMTVQSNTEVRWEDKIPKVFWRGRDSRHERLELIELGRKNPDLFNVSLTNFFFFRDKENIYGPKEAHISFFKFFDYKYQLNIDGTVAAYRFPFLLGGDGVVFKVDSTYIEHFYSELKPWVHYIPVTRFLRDLPNKIQWARDNDEKARRIGTNARKWVQSNLMPLDIFCYHATALKEWAKRLKNPVLVRPGMELVQQPKLPNHNICQCNANNKQQQFNDIEDKIEL